MWHKKRTGHEAGKQLCALVADAVGAQHECLQRVVVLQHLAQLCGAQRADAVLAEVCRCAPALMCVRNVIMSAMAGT